MILEWIRCMSALAGIGLTLMLSAQIKAWARRGGKRRERHV